MKAAAASLLLLGLVLAATTDGATDSPGATLGPVINGSASNYGGPQDQINPYTPYGGVINGACGYGQLASDQWPYWAAAGVNSQSPLIQEGEQPKGACGICIQVVCSDPVNCPADAANHPTVLQVTDACPSCSPNQINVHFLAFNRGIADASLGNVTVQYQQVECKPPGPIRVKIGNYRASGGGFVSLALTDLAGGAAIRTLELRSSPGANLTQAVVGGLMGSSVNQWQQMQNAYGAMWQLSGLPLLPWDLRITSEAKQEQLIARGVITAPVQVRKVYTSRVQFSTTTSPAYLGQPGSVLDPAPATNASVGNAQGGGAAALAPIHVPQPNCIKTPFELLKSQPDASTYLSIAGRIGLASALQNENATNTYLVPTNAAFSKLTPAVLNTTDDATMNLVMLYMTLRGQMRTSDVSGAAMAGRGPVLPEDMVNGQPSIKADTINGERLQVAATNGTAGHPPKLQFIGRGSNATTVIPDMLTCNAVIQKIDSVLLP